MEQNDKLGIIFSRLLMVLMVIVLIMYFVSTVSGVVPFLKNSIEKKEVIIVSK